MNASYKKGQIVKYTNGSPTIQTGTIKKVMTYKTYVSYLILDETDLAAKELWNAGYAIGDDISQSQIIGIAKEESK